jgi:hypothetical protein
LTAFSITRICTVDVWLRIIRGIGDIEAEPCADLNKLVANTREDVPPSGRVHRDLAGLGHVDHRCGRPAAAARRPASLKRLFERLLDRVRLLTRRRLVRLGHVLHARHGGLQATLAAQELDAPCLDSVR